MLSISKLFITWVFFQFSNLSIDNEISTFYLEIFVTLFRKFVYFVNLYFATLIFAYVNVLIMLSQPLKGANKTEHPITSSAAISCLSTPLQPTKTTNSIATQYSYSSIYDNVMLSPPDLPPDLPSDEDEVLCYNPNEPRYCICNQVSYGSMIACDNKLCPYEWFHFRCVGIIRPPKGKWYCPLCKSSRQQRRGSGRKRKFSW